MEELKLLIGMVSDLPQMALWVLIGYLVYKLAVIGSVYSVIKFCTARLFDYLKSRHQRSRDVEISATINGMCITMDNTHQALIQQLDRIRGKGFRTGTPGDYIHRQSVEWLRDAITAKEQEDTAKNKTTRNTANVGGPETQ